MIRPKTVNSWTLVTVLKQPSANIGGYSMKTEDLKEKGLTEEQISFIMAENGKDIKAEQQKYATLEAERDNLKGQLETTQASLKEFEGIDVKDLQTKIAQLNTDLQAKETEYQYKIANMQFENTLKDEITAMGGRSVKAVMAELDIEGLKISKNQKEDIKTALESCKKEHDFLFGSNEPINNPNVDTTKGGTGDNDVALNTLRAAMGLKPRE